MTFRSRPYRVCALLLGLGMVWACPFDVSLREYLSGAFWLPFAKRAAAFERPHVRRMDAPFAGMSKDEGDTPLARLRAAYRPISQPVMDTEPLSFDARKLRQMVAAARSDPSLTAKQKEEVELLDAKIDMRAASPGSDQLLLSAKNKLAAFLKTARTPEYRSEARGWLARVHYLMGDQTGAGKMYLDELNRNGSNLSRETLLNSLRMNYGYDGGQDLLDHLEDYFDSPEHAAFAIQLVTNPHWSGDDHPVWAGAYNRFQRDRLPEQYPRIKALLAKHTALLQSSSGTNSLALLAMRTALRMGDPPSARDIGEGVPADAAIRREPDFNWMLASAHFLAHEYGAAERPLLALFQASRSSIDEKAAAAYGLCGVYRKTGNVQEQLRFALWLRTTAGADSIVAQVPVGLSDFSVHWASSGWDLNFVLEAEASIDDLTSFIEQNPGLANIRIVKYSLAVRLARENRYREAADLYTAIHALVRAARMRQLANLYGGANQTGVDDQRLDEARYKLAEFISANPDRIYFNDAIWQGYQRYAFQASTDSRLTRAERDRQIALERKLKDDQEERWRAYLILQEIVGRSNDPELARRSALLGLRCLRGINERFGRGEEIAQADIDLSRWLRKAHQ